MNHSLSIGQLKKLKVIMRAMLSEATNANWQELSRLDSERRVLISYKSTASEGGEYQIDSTQNQRQQSSGMETESTSRAPSDSTTPGAHSPSALRVVSAASKPDPVYLALSSELLAIDKELSKTVQAARLTLLEQTRGLKAQVSAKKRYEQANIMKASSYS